MKNATSASNLTATRPLWGIFALVLHRQSRASVYDQHAVMGQRLNRPASDFRRGARKE